jgi:hypothetical protein
MTYGTLRQQRSVPILAALLPLNDFLTNAKHICLG